MRQGKEVNRELGNTTTYLPFQERYGVRKKERQKRKFENKYLH
jgi:hypothetical protein